jgi:hypothetical protein
VVRQKKPRNVVKQKIYKFTSTEAACGQAKKTKERCKTKNLQIYKHRGSFSLGSKQTYTPPEESGTRVGFDWASRWTASAATIPSPGHMGSPVSCTFCLSPFFVFAFF